MTEFMPDWASPPGDSIQELLELKGLSWGHLALRLPCGVSTKGLMEGTVRINPGIAHVLEEVVGGDWKFWVRRDIHFGQQLRYLFAKDRGK